MGAPFGSDVASACGRLIETILSLARQVQILITHDYVATSETPYSWRPIGRLNEANSFVEVFKVKERRDGGPGRRL